MSSRKKLTGLWALLTDEQKQKALAYDGPINFGDDGFNVKPVNPDLPGEGARD